MRAEPVALDRERPQVEVAALLEQLRAPVDVDALAVHEVEPQRVEDAALHLHRQARRRSPGSLSVKKTDAHRSCRRSSVTSPSTQTVGSRCEPASRSPG